MKTVSSVVRFGMILLALVAASSVEAQTSISKLPYTITKPGNYALFKSLNYVVPKTGAPTAAITINCDDVTIDLKGNTLSMDRELAKTVTFSGIFANERKHITIRNGIIKNFFRGVFLEGSTLAGSHLIEGLEVADCTFLGIQVKGRGSMIRDNFVNVVGRADGASIYLPERYGIHLTGAGISVLNNRVFEVIFNTTAANHTAYGIYMDAAESGIIKNNSVINTTQSISLVNTRGIKLNNCNGSILEDNRVTAYWTGFEFTACSNTVYANNTVGRAGGKYYTTDGSGVDGGGNK